MRHYVLQMLGIRKPLDNDRYLIFWPGTDVWAPKITRIYVKPFRVGQNILNQLSLGVAA